MSEIPKWVEKLLSSREVANRAFRKTSLVTPSDYFRDLSLKITCWMKFLYINDLSGLEII